MAKLSNSLALVFLALAIVVSAWEPPKLPAGRRVQYYIQHPQGDYLFGYDTGEGSYHAARSDSSNRVRGNYQYSSDNSPGGFAYSYTGGYVRPGAEVKASGLSVASASANLESPPAVTSYDSGPSDASYSFSFDAGDHSRQESSDAGGNVVGSYAFVAKDGVNRKVDYEAGAGKGFVAQGAHLPVAPQPGAEGLAPVSAYVAPPVSTGPYSAPPSNVDGSYSFSYDAGDHSRQESSDAAGNVRGRFAFVAKDGVQRKVDYEAGAEKGFTAKGDHLPVAPSPLVAPVLATFKYDPPKPAFPPAAIDSSANQDGSYSFSYDAGDHSRQESADAAGNVRGQFSFVAKDGVNRKVDYEAGREKGFFAKGAHLPVALDHPAQVPISYRDSSRSQALPPFSSESDGAPVDGSYSFSYDAGDHSREESSDAAGNVQGKYSFVAKDGLRRKVNYEAGAEKGFLATGDHLPSAPASLDLQKTIPSRSSIPTLPSPIAGSIPSTKFADISSGAAPDGSYSFSYDAGDHSREESADSFGNVRGRFAFTATDGVNRKVDYEAGAEKGFVAKGAHLPVAPEAPISAAAPAFTPSSYSHSKQAVSTFASSDTSPVDGSYSFSYNAGDHAREESSDSAGNVKGRFSFVAKDGINRKVEYEAGAEKGFVAKGDHIPQTDSVELKKITHSPASLPAPSLTGSYVAPASVRTPAKSATIHSTASGDRSYSFSYDAEDHSRQESADAAGNVRGQFAFVAKDGVNRKVQYTAGADRGFEAKGLHLPVAPEAPVHAAKSTFTQFSSQAVKPVVPLDSPNTLESGPVDGSYSFSYDADDHSRQESADSAGNVRGHFSFIAKDGINRKVDYEAGAEKGFVARGDHIPSDVNYNSRAGVGSAAPIAVVPYAQPVAPSFPASVISSGPVDASYAFSYDASDHSREESADAAGNVRGRFSFLAKDGINRRVDYEAGAEKGFLAKGSHLPVPALVGGADGLGYQYSYETDSSKKAESSDANGFVTGSFSYLGADGLTRKVDYRAGGEEGFVVSGDHLQPATSAVAKLPSPVSLKTTHSSSSKPFFSSIGSLGASSSSYSSSAAKSKLSSSAPFSVRTFLPHETPSKFGYIYDSLA